MSIESYCFYKVAATDLKAYTAVTHELAAIAASWASSFAFKRRLTEKDPVTCLEIARFDSLDRYHAWLAERDRQFQKINSLIIGGPKAIRCEVFTEL